MNAGGVYSLGDLLRGSDEEERLLEPGDAAVVVDMRQVRRQAIARRRWLQHKLRAVMDHKVRRAEHACAERLDQEFQDDDDEPVRQIPQDPPQTVLYAATAPFHSPFY